MNKMIRKLLVLGGLTFLTSSAQAIDLPAVNLGLTSFLDGAPPPSGPGWYFAEYLQRYSADRSNDDSGNRLALPRQDLDLTISVNQFLYLSERQVAGADVGVSIIVSALLSAQFDDGLGNTVLSAQTGVGDSVVGLFLQWNPVMGPDGPRYAHRFEVTVIAPTGEYDRRIAVNPGSNFWSFNPYWAGTLWISPKWTLSTRLHYLWNAKNTKPSVAFGPDVSSTQAGQGVHANLTTEYAVTPQLRLGLNGYWLRQITDTKANGVDVPGRREQVWAVGPGLLYGLSQHDFVFLNTYFEHGVRNRPQGSRIQFRYVHHFD